MHCLSPSPSPSPSPSLYQSRAFNKPSFPLYRAIAGGDLACRHAWKRTLPHPLGRARIHRAAAPCYCPQNHTCVPASDKCRRRWSGDRCSAVEPAPRSLISPDRVASRCEHMTETPSQLAGKGRVGDSAAGGSKATQGQEGARACTCLSFTPPSCCSFPHLLASA